MSVAEVNRTKRESTLNTEEMVLSMGPHHPSTHGVLRLEVVTDGEVVVSVKPDLGYLHRAIEKIGENVEYFQFVLYTDRVDYVCAMNSNFAYCLAVEKLGGFEVPRRAEYLRVIMAELNRISSHMICVGALAMDMGAFTPFLYSICYREQVNDLFESVCGARLTYNYYTIGGVAHDAPDDFVANCRKFVDYLEPKMHEFNELITGNSIFVERLANVGIATAAEALSWGLVGPNLRGSGVNFDLRRDEPYSIYPELDFDVPVGDGKIGTLGDCYSRYVVRVKEVFESIKIIRQCLDRIEPGPVQGKVPKVIKLKKGEVYMRSENPRGETGYYLSSTGRNGPDRVKIRTGSFTAMGIFDHICRGLLIGDVIAVIGSLDIVLPEVDR